MEKPTKKQTTLQKIIEGLPAELRVSTAGIIEMKQLLNQDPPKSWVKKHPKGYHYLPVDKVELLLNLLYRKHEVQIISYQQILNSIVVHVRLKCVNFDNSTVTVDGIGAAPIHTAKGAGAMDYEKVNVESVQNAAPAAYAFALKNAAKRLGNIFGTNIERDDTLSFIEISTKSIDVQSLKNIEI